MLPITIIREMHIKTAMKYYLKPVRTASIKKTRNNKCWQECGEKETPVTLGGQIDRCSLLWRNSTEGPQKIKIQLPYGPAIPLLGIYLRKQKH